MHISVFWILYFIEVCMMIIIFEYLSAFLALRFILKLYLYCMGFYIQFNCKFNIYFMFLKMIAFVIFVLILDNIQTLK